MSEPREWWIRRDSEDICWVLVKSNAPDYYPTGKVRVIEHSAYAKLEAENARLREALGSIARNSCCDRCQEAALVAREALK